MTQSPCRARSLLGALAYVRRALLSPAGAGGRALTRRGFRSNPFRSALIAHRARSERGPRYVTGHQGRGPISASQTYLKFSALLGQSKVDSRKLKGEMP